MAQDEIARGMAARALKEIQTLDAGDPLVTSVNGQTGSVELSAHDIHAEKEDTVVVFNLGRAYALMQPDQVADVTSMIGLDKFNAICSDLYAGGKKVIIIDGMVVDIYGKLSNSISCCMHELYVVDGNASVKVYDINLYSTTDKVQLECVANDVVYFGKQANYIQTDSSAIDFIKNKPTFEVGIDDVSQDAQGHTVVTIDKTRQQIANALTLGKLVYIDYDGKVMFYGENGGAGFHYRYLTADAILAGEDNIATAMVDNCLLFASSTATEKKLLLTSLIFEK